MKRALGAKNKLKFVDGSIEVLDEDDLNYAQWEPWNHPIYSWIINSFSGQISLTILYHEHAIDVWNDLHECFFEAGRVRILTLCSTINSMKQNSKWVMEYFLELNGLWKELNSHRPLPICTCAHCCCRNVVRKAQEHRLEKQAIQFFTSLNNTFSLVRT